MAGLANLARVLTSWTDLIGRVTLAADQATDQAADQVAARAAGQDLLDRYAEPARHYHDGRHLAEVLAAVDRLAAHAERPDAVRLAAWFHDAVYQPQAAAGANEEASAVLAETVLTALGVEAGVVGEVAELVRMTASHEAVGADEIVLSDADLAILGADPARYAAYAADVRREYAHVPDPAFRAGRGAILRGLAGRPRIYLTPTGYAAWEQPARANLAAELAQLADGPPPDVSAPGR